MPMALISRSDRTVPGTVQAHMAVAPVTAFEVVVLTPIDISVVFRGWAPLTRGTWRQQPDRPVGPRRGIAEPGHDRRVDGHRDVDRVRPGAAASLTS